ncbi:hypothetical protein D3C83_25370 [compost metagenome]
MCSPPAATTWLWSFCQLKRISSILCFFAAASSAASASTRLISGSGLPPSTISVPRPAMLVAMVTILGRPAWITISASRACCLAFSTLCGSCSFLSISESISEFSIEVVPTSAGWPRS